MAMGDKEGTLSKVGQSVTGRGGSVKVTIAPYQEEGEESYQVLDPFHPNIAGTHKEVDLIQVDLLQKEFEGSPFSVEV